MTEDDSGISRPLAEAPDAHTILIVGSGYGGGVAAARLARTGQAVTVLERGREFAPGDFPDNMLDFMAETQVTLSHSGKTHGKADGLYDFRVSDNVNAALGCGLGGGSLVNANVAIEADPRSLQDWPAPYCEPGALDPYYARARAMLGSQPYPEGKTLPKLDAMAQVADGMGLALERPDINVTFEDGYNAAGVFQPACTNCGDCVSGCNVGAKNTVAVTYLADAAKSGAAIYVGAEVQRLVKIDTNTETKWQVEVKDVASGGIRILTADTVILAAGTFGSTEILLRSETQESTETAPPKFSKALGTGFSSNGDVWAFGYNANMPDEERVGIKNPRKPVYGVGAGDQFDDSDPRRTPGPCITGMIKVGQDEADLHKRMIIEEGVMPGALAPVYAGLYPMQDVFQGDYFRFGDVGVRMNDFLDLARVLKDNPTGFAQTAYDGPVSRTLPFLVMNHDSASGTMKLRENRVYVDWPDAGKEPAFKAAETALTLAADAVQAEYLPWPTSERGFDDRVTLVHPLGGCPMGETAETGVVNANCQVFERDGGLHDGLYVMDGSVLPTAIGVNPHLTITAVAECAVETLVGAQGWHIDPAPHGPDDTAPMEDVLPDLASQLSLAVEVLRWMRAQIQQGADLGWFLRMYWDRLYAMYDKLSVTTKLLFPIPDTETFMAYAGTRSGQQVVVLPIVVQALVLVEPVQKAVADGDMQKALALLEDGLGDFSPYMTFPEEMVGRVSTAGLGDDVAQHDPYSVAARGPDNFKLTATVEAARVRQIIDDDGVQGCLSGEARWTDDTTQEETVFDVEGTYKYLIMNPHQIECWNMVYEGKMTPQGQGGRPLYYRGVKTLQLREESHWWTDLTELALDIYAADALIPTHDPIDPTQMVARGVIVVSFEGVIQQAHEIAFAYTEDQTKQSLKQAYEDIKRAVIDGPKEDLPQLTANLEWRGNAVLGAFFIAFQSKPDWDGATQLATFYGAKTLGKMGILALRTYGRFLSYMVNFPASAPRIDLAGRLPEPVIYTPSVPGNMPGETHDLKLTRYQGGTKGPVLVAAGFGAIAKTFATPTVEQNFVEALVADGFDVWLFDYRGSGDLPASMSKFDMDDVATRDFPAAIDMILKERDDCNDVQVVVHCVGSLLFFMAMLAGESRVRSVVSSQLGPHTIINWFKYAQADGHIADYFEHGLPKSMWPLVEMMHLGEPVTKALKEGFDEVNPSARKTEMSEPGTPFKDDKPMSVEQFIDGLIWDVPNFAPTVCNSPTCHRINFFFGPTYQHEQLNQATHDAIMDMFGKMSPAPFPQIARCFEVGHAVSNSQDIAYMDHPEQLRMPIHFIVGAKNPLMVPECSLRTIAWLKETNVDLDHLYTREVYQEYGHIDCFIGRDAWKDIFPDIVKKLNETHDFKPGDPDLAAGG
ncbi:MAG: alpha/beta fold hydrolase [Pseudomonadota bacterium]